MARVSKKFRSQALNHEIDEAQRLFDAALKNMNKLRKELGELDRQRKTVKARVNKRKPDKRSRAEDPARLQEIEAARRRGKRLLTKLEKIVTEKKRRLGELRQQANRFDRGLESFRRNLEPAETPPSVLNGAQIRCARAMLDLSQQALAKRVGISVSTMCRLERETAAENKDADLLFKVLETLEKAGVEIIPEGPYTGTGGPGIRLKSQHAGQGRKRLRRVA